MQPQKSENYGRKKIVLLFNSFVTLSGGDVRLIEIAKRIKNLDKIIITTSKGKQICERSGLDAKYLVTVGKSEGIIKNVLLSYFIRIMNAFVLEVPMVGKNILYASSDFLPDVLPAFIMKKSKNNLQWVQQIYHLIPSPSQREGSFFTNFASFIAQKASFVLIKRDADLIFVLNNIIRTKLVRQGFSENKIFVTGAGINVSQIDHVIRSEGTAYDACFLGRLHEAKGIFDLIEIWKLVVSKNKNAKLAIIYIGPKNLELAMMKRIGEEKLHSNVFMLPLTGNDALSVVKSSKIFVFPSHEEGWGIAIAEAMTCSLPVIAYDLPVYKEIFSQGMVTVPMFNLQNFSAEILNLLENDEKARALGKKGRAHVATYDWDSVAARELALMKSRLKNK
jgi:glycosyltransferase involved in cell wall biosynthesis